MRGPEQALQTESGETPQAFEAFERFKIIQSLGTAAVNLEEEAQKLRETANLLNWTSYTAPEGRVINAHLSQIGQMAQGNFILEVRGEYGWQRISEETISYKDAIAEHKHGGQIFTGKTLSYDATVRGICLKNGKTRVILPESTYISEAAEPPQE